MLWKIAWRDAKEQKIANRDVMLVMLLGMVRLITESGNVMTYVVGVLAISLPMLILVILVPGSFGGGDIKLMAAGGFYLGYHDVVDATLIALFSAGAYSVWKLLVEKENKKTRFALGPFLCLGMAVAGW